MDYKVSIIMPVYNAEKKLNYIINKITTQSYENYELIIINDGSTDNTEEIISNYKDNKKIKYIFQSNRGPGSARNKGLDIADGDYIMFIDSDDEFEDNMVSDMVKIISESSADIVQFAYYARNALNGNKIIQSNPKEIIVLDDKKEALYEMTRYTKMNSYLWTKIFSKNVTKDIKFPDLYYSEDQVFIIKAINNSKKIILHPNAYYTYEFNPDSITNSKFNEKQLDSIKSMGEIIKYYENNDIQLVGYYYKKICIYIINILKAIQNEGKSKDYSNIIIELKKSYKKSYKKYKSYKDVVDETMLKERLLLFIYMYCFNIANLYYGTRK